MGIWPSFPFRSKPAPTAEERFSMDATLSQAEDFIDAQKFAEGQELISLVTKSKTSVPLEVQDRADSILCESYVDSGRFGKAISLANRIVRKNRDSYPNVLARAIIVRAAAKGFLGNPKQCLKDTSKIVDGEVKATTIVYLEALQLRAVMKLAIGDREGSLKDYDELVSTMPRACLGRLGAGLICRAMVRWRTDDDELAKQDAVEGAALLSQVEEKEQNIGPPLQGMALVVQEKWLEAIPFFTQGIDHPYNPLCARLGPLLRLFRAYCHEEGCELAEAIKEYRTLVKELSGFKFFEIHFAVWAQLCMLAMRTGEPERALVYCSRALHISLAGTMRRFRPYLLYLRSMIRIRLGRLREARSDLRKLRRDRYIKDIKEVPFEGLIGYVIATTHATEGNHQEALEAIEEVFDSIELSPALRARCLALRGVIKHFMGEGIDATVDARKAAEMSITKEIQDDPIRKEADRLFDNPDEWTELFVSASSDTERAKIWLFRARMLFASERWEETEECLERVTENYAHCKREYLQALELFFFYYTILGEYNRAMEITRHIAEAEAITLFDPVKELVVSKLLGSG